jgi:hypothetical protein
MVRTINTEPAICPSCGFDFIGSGRYRYSNLKNHMKKQHGIMSGSKITINNTTNNYNIVIMNGVFDVESVKKLLTPSVMEQLQHILETNDGYLMIPLFNALHCNPDYPETHIASIPNISKDTMLVMSKVGNVQPRTKQEGARMVLDHMIENDVPVIQKSIDDDVLSYALKNEKNIPSDCVPGIIKHLETLPKNVRNSTSKKLKEMV